MPFIEYEYQEKNDGAMLSIKGITCDSSAILSIVIKGVPGAEFRLKGARISIRDSVGSVAVSAVPDGYITPELLCGGHLILCEPFLKEGGSLYTTDTGLKTKAKLEARIAELEASLADCKAELLEKERCVGSAHTFILQ